MDTVNHIHTLEHTTRLVSIRFYYFYHLFLQQVRAILNIDIISEDADNWTMSSEVDFLMRRLEDTTRLDEFQTPCGHIMKLDSYSGLADCDQSMISVKICGRIWCSK